MADKAPYKLVVKFDGARPEKIAEALAQLREHAADYDLTGESTATMTIESWQEAPLRGTMDDFELWLYRHAPGLVKDQGMVLYRPGLRPETAEMLAREKRRTPMDSEGWEGAEEEADESIITPPPFEPRQLPPPADWVEGEVIEELEAQADEHERALDEAEEERRLATEELEPIGSDAPPALVA